MHPGRTGLTLLSKLRLGSAQPYPETSPAPRGDEKAQGVTVSQGVRKLKSQGGSGSTFSYRDTAANRSECINDWNCLSSALKCISTCELSESTVSASMAAFSTGEALIFL